MKLGKLHVLFSSFVAFLFIIYVVEFILGMVQSLVNSENKVGICIITNVYWRFQVELQNIVKLLKIIIVKFIYILRIHFQLYWNKMKNKKYHTVGTVLKYHTVGTVLKYHTVGTVLKYNGKTTNTTLSEQF